MTHVEKEIIPSPSQAIANAKIQAFMKSEHRIFRLIGPAGYGKTTTIATALKNLLAKDYDERGHGNLPQVVGIALAHKAKRILGKSIHNVETFAKAFGYKEWIDEATGVRTFKPATFFEEPPIGHSPCTVFVHDEISMYSQKMLDIILKETPKRSKIILMGDFCQLPSPDGNDNDLDSPTFYLDLPEECQHELTDPIRQSEGNPILELGKALREEITGSKDVNRIISLILNSKIIDGYGIEIKPKLECLQEYIYLNDFMNNKFICYTKAKVEKINTEIRNIVFDNPTERVIENDIIFLTNNFKVKEPSFQLHNSDEYIVTNVTKQMYKVGNMHIESYFAIVPKSDYNYPVYVVLPTWKGQKVLKTELERLASEAKINGKMWFHFYRLQGAFTDFTMGFSINAHKAQGSTYGVVYFDLMDTLNCGALSPKRMLQTIYTVITRASQKVVFIKPE